MYSWNVLWAPVEGYKVFRTVPIIRTKPVFAPVSKPDIRELDALDEFIKLKLVGTQAHGFCTQAHKGEKEEGKNLVGRWNQTWSEQAQT